MKGQCCICTELFEANSDISAILCGHTFHARCLQQWLEHSRTCPHCRTTINKKTVVPKLYFDTADDGEGAAEDVSSIKNELAEAKAQLRAKDKEKSDLQSEHETHKQQTAELRENMRSMEVLYKQERSSVSALKKELRFHKELQNEAELAREEAKTLKTKLEDLKNVEKIVRGHQDEIDSIVSRGDTKQLSTWCCILQKELNGKRQECRTLRDTVDKFKKESSLYRREASEKGDALHAAKEQVRILQEELKDTDREVMKLKKKNDTLLKAIGSPSDSARSFAHRLVQESPAPRMTPPKKKPRLSDHNESLIQLDDLDTSADMFSSPNLNAACGPSPATTRRKQDCEEYGTKFVKITTAAKKNAATQPPKKDMTDISNIPGLSNFNLFKKKAGMGLADSESSSVIKKGYNGFGGHEKFINVKSRDGFKAPAPVVKKQKMMKFGPNKTVSKTCPPLPTLNGFLSQD